jgi:hypothetical protein
MNENALKYSISPFFVIPFSEQQIVQILQNGQFPYRQNEHSNYGAKEIEGDIFTQFSTIQEILRVTVI